MQAVSQRIDLSGAVVTTVEALPAGRAGTVRTLALIQQSVIEALSNAAILTTAAIAAGMSSRSTSAREEIARVQRWVQQNIRYVLDPDRIELLQSPELTLQRRAGDCDDHTALVCALLSALGYPARMVAVGFHRGLFAHVYSEVLIHGRWTAVETIKPWPLGKSPTGVVERLELPIAAPITATPLNGLFSSIGKKLKKVTKLAVRNAPAIALGVATGGAGGIAIAAGGVAAGERSRKEQKLADTQVEAATINAQAAAMQAQGPSLVSWIEQNKTTATIAGGLIAALLAAGLSASLSRGRR